MWKEIRLPESWQRHGLAEGLEIRAGLDISGIGSNLTISPAQFGKVGVHFGSESCL